MAPPYRQRPNGKRPSDLRADLREEIRQLEYQFKHFDELAPDQRFSSRQTYESLIRVRRELLSLLELDNQVNPEHRLLSSRSSESSS